MAPYVLTEEDNPLSLRDLCLLFCVKNTETFSEYDSASRRYSLKDGVSLPPEICESLVEAYADLGKILDDNFMHIFKDHMRTHLRHINVQNSNVTETSLQWLIEHKPTELSISGCKDVTSRTLQSINQYGKNLVKLFIGNCVNIFQDIQIKERSAHQPSAQGDSNTRVLGGDYIFDCPELRALSIHSLNKDEWPAHDIIATAIHPLNKLTYLDLSMCNIEMQFMNFLEGLDVLQTLILYNVPLSDLPAAFQQIGKLKTLRSLDLSQASLDQKDPVMYSEPEKNLAYLVSNLPELKNLDLSGTNLSGFLKIEEVSHRPEPKRGQEEKKQCAIPGLEGRHLDFLGILNCPYEASHRENLPADKVAGGDTASQIIFACHTYIDKPVLLVKALENLCDVFQYFTRFNTVGAMTAVLNAMRRYPLDRPVQHYGSLCFYYLLKDDRNRERSPEIKIHIRKILNAVLNAMENHITILGVVKTCMLTIENMEMPGDVMKDYKRVMVLMLKLLASFEENNGASYLQRRCFQLINHLAVQVDLKEKEMVGDLGAITLMMNIIKKRLETDKPDEHGYFDDDSIEHAWSVLWNYSDETPRNCERFMNGGGMDLLIKCFQTFPQRGGLMRNMMGLVGNVAEMDELRPRLIKKEYIQIFIELLESRAEGIEIGYHACGVLAHIMADGPEVWTIEEPERWLARKRMLRALRTWSTAARRDINYRSFMPLLKLVPLEGDSATLMARHWAVWALCNLTEQYPRRFCDLVRDEGGMVLLNRLFTKPKEEVTDEVRRLAERVLIQVRYWFDDNNLGKE